MDFEITEAQHVKDYQIKITFFDGSNGIADLSKYVDEHTVFKAFQNINYFKNFKIEYGTLVWGNGELDLAPETLYELATGKSIKYHSKISTR